MPISPFKTPSGPPNLAVWISTKSVMSAPSGFFMKQRITRRTWFKKKSGVRFYRNLQIFRVTYIWLPLGRLGRARPKRPPCALERSIGRVKTRPRQVVA